MVEHRDPLAEEDRLGADAAPDQQRPLKAGWVGTRVGEASAGRGGAAVCARACEGCLCHAGDQLDMVRYGEIWGDMGRYAFATRGIS